MLLYHLQFLIIIGKHIELRLKMGLSQRANLEFSVDFEVICCRLRSFNIRYDRLMKN